METRANEADQVSLCDTHTYKVQGIKDLHNEELCINRNTKAAFLVPGNIWPFLQKFTDDMWNSVW